MNNVPMEEQNKIRADAKEALNKHKRIFDKWLRMEYNIHTKKLVDAESEKVRGQIDFITTVHKLLDL